MTAPGILIGDRLVAISSDATTYEQIGSAPEVQIYLEEAGVGGHLNYFISGDRRSRLGNAFLLRRPDHF
ncbi:MAG: hypothetical protein WKF84_26785 [Pyrinomonadaceae bacterium]